MTARKYSPEPSELPLADPHPAQGSPSGAAQSQADSHMRLGVTGLSPEPSERPLATEASAQGPPSVPPTGSSTASTEPAAPDFIGLRIWAESFADAQQTRIALVNRMERGGVDGDLLEGHRRNLEASEHAFKLSMVRSYRDIVRRSMPAVEEWQKFYFGIGEHLVARLLGHLGHPRIAEPYRWMDDAPDGHVCIPERCGKRHLVALQPFERTLRQLWSYCGVGSPDRRRKGMTQEEALALGNPQLKMLLRLLAEATIKCRPQPIDEPTATPTPAGAEQSTPPMPHATARTGSAGSGPSSKAASTAIKRPVRDRYYYRRVYDARKESTVDRGWTDGHRHADALRIVSKEIVRDLWTAAQTIPDSHAQAGGSGGPS